MQHDAKLNTLRSKLAKAKTETAREELRRRIAEREDELRLKPPAQAPAPAVIAEQPQPAPPLKAGKPAYLSAEHAQSAELQRWVDAQPPGPMAGELGLLRWLLADAAANKLHHLCGELSQKIVAIEKVAQVLATQSGEWTKPSDLARYRDCLCDAIVSEFACEPATRQKLAGFRPYLAECLGTEIDADTFDGAAQEYFGDCLDWQDRVERLADRFAANARSYKNGDKLSAQPLPAPK